MIASRPVSEEPLLENDYSRDITSNIFHGLTFPEAPKTTPIISRSVPKLNDEYIELKDCEQTKIKSPLQVSQINVASAGESQTWNAPINQNTKANIVSHGIEDTTRQLSKLYSTKKVTVEPMYPDMPEISLDSVTISAGATQMDALRPQVPIVSVSMLNVSSSLVTNNKNEREISSSSTHSSWDVCTKRQENGEMTDVNIPFTNLQDTVSYATGRIESSVAATRSTEMVSPPDVLINDLINENARLQRQLEDLRTAMAATVSAPASEATASDLRIQQGTILSIQPPAPQLQQNGNANSSASRSKYIRCGSCQNWLMSPQAAVMVYCPICKVVNDCSRVQTNNGVTPVSAERVVAVRRLEARPWYLQCFSRAHF